MHSFVRATVGFPRTKVQAAVTLAVKFTKYKLLTISVKLRSGCENGKALN